MIKFLNCPPIAFLLSLFGLTACQQNTIIPLRIYNPHGAELTYESDTINTDDPGDDTLTSARLSVAPSGKLTFQYMNNETEVFRPRTYTVRLWLADETADPSRAYLDALGDTKYDHPEYVIAKTANGRSYTRKTVHTGWYLAEFDGSGVFYKFQIMAGSNGLLCHNENSFTSVHFRGYYSSFGKVKVSWKTAPGNLNGGLDETANLALTKDGATQNFWLYAEDGTGKYKGQFWFIPTGTYAYTTPGGLAAGTVTIASSGRYPNIRFF